MQLHDLKTKYAKRKRKRIGRGGKRGTTSGKGQKGQRARAGHHILQVERIMIMKFPKLRGVKNKSRKETAVIITLNDLAGLTKNGKVTKQILLEKGIISKMFQPVKVLSNGNISSAVTVEGISVSAGAKEKIEKAGGKVI
ncbi:MAG: 50S ribosomal protein L15 [Minisyncoccia bacterium]|jgi:large subunit ribosomal protein L15